MTLEAIKSYIGHVWDDAARLWDEQQLARLGYHSVPDSVFLQNRSILRADATVLWVRWFVDALVDRGRARHENASFGQLYLEVSRCLDRLFLETPKDKRQSAARAIAKAISNELRRTRRFKRRHIAWTTRRALVARLDTPPRCEICGYAFSGWALRRFLGLEPEQERPPLPMFLDKTKPIGAHERDVRIEVDHIAPAARAGADEADNLQLLCGWCNRSKADHLTLYDVGSYPRFRDGESLPQPLWVVRLLALRRRCEAPGGCLRNPRNEELTVAKRLDSGAFNPTNMYVVCREHDPWRAYRWVARSRYNLTG